VLVVDDNKVNLRVMLSLLGRLMDASNVTTAVDGAGALRALLSRVVEGNTKPLIVLMDIQMPRLDGNEATRLWRLVQKSLRGAIAPTFIIAISAGHLSSLERSSFNATLEKPVLFAGLRAVLDEGAAFLKHAAREAE